MSSNIGIIFFLMLPSLIIAKDIELKTDAISTREVFLIIGLMFGTTIATVSLFAFIYLIIRCIRASLCKPQYYIDDISSNIDGNVGDKNLFDHIPNINEIQPSLNVAHMASAVKQSLVDLRDCFLPLSWTQKQNVQHPEKPVNEIMDLPI